MTPFTKDGAGGKYKGPDLFYAGNKFQSAWLEEFLQKPEIIRIAGHTSDPEFLKGRPAMMARHPVLANDEALAVGKYLMSLKIEGVEPGKVDTTPLSQSQKVKTKIIKRPS